MSRVLPSRRQGTHVRRTPIRRDSRPLRSIQIAAALVMALCLVGIAGIGYAPSFAGRVLELRGTKFTSESIIRKIVGMDGTPNLFRLETDRIAAELVRLPAVKSARVQVRLPSTVIVDIVERQPKLVWVIGDSRFVVDEEGLLFGQVDAAGNPVVSSAGPLPTPSPDTGATATPEDTASGGASGDIASPSPRPTPTASPTPKPTAVPKPSKTPTRNPKATPTKAGSKASAAPTPSPSPAGSPTPTPNPSIVPSLQAAPTEDSGAVSGPLSLALSLVHDRRSIDANLTLGGVIDPVNLDAGFRLAGLTPADVGSTTTALAVVLDDDHGFTLSSVPTGWVAQFGFYAPNVRKVTVIPAQVRVLRSMFAEFGEAKVFWVFLVSDIGSDRVSTYLPR
ncbi:MAG TPA: FtsQ-type POTRA domain-containing protein [Candidatus Limnocylindrales bacterium]